MVTFGKVKLCFVGCRKFGMVSRQLRVMEPERSAADVPGGNVDSQLTPAEIQLKSSILNKLDWVSGRYITNFVPAEEISDLVKILWKMTM